MSKQRRNPQMCSPRPQVSQAPQQPAFEAFSNAEMCEMVRQNNQTATPDLAQEPEGYSPPGTIPTALNLTEMRSTIQTHRIQRHNQSFLRDHTPINHGPGMRHKATGQYRKNQLKDVPEVGPAGKMLKVVNTGLSLYSLHNNAQCTANDSLGWEDRYQCGVGATSDIAGLTPFVPAQMFSTAVGLQQYGAGDIHKQTDTIAQQGNDVRRGLRRVLGDNVFGQVISEIGGGVTVAGSSLAHGISNFGKAGYKIGKNTVGAVGDAVDWVKENSRPATVQDAVQRANSGCLTHASHKAGVYLDGMGLDRQGQHKPINGLDFDLDRGRDPFGVLDRGPGKQEPELNQEEQAMLLKYLMGNSTQSSNTPEQ